MTEHLERFAIEHPWFCTVYVPFAVFCVVVARVIEQVPQ